MHSTYVSRMHPGAQQLPLIIIINNGFQDIIDSLDIGTRRTRRVDGGSRVGSDRSRGIERKVNWTTIVIGRIIGRNESDCYCFHRRLLLGSRETTRRKHQETGNRSRIIIGECN